VRRSCPSRRSSPTDSGSALVITLMVMALVAALATTVATLSIRNLQSAQLSQQAGVAVGAADAGVAQAVSYLRANGVHDLCAAPTVYNPPAPDFNNAFDLATQRCVTSLAAAQRVPGQPYSVVIVTGAAYPRNDLGSYTIYSRGIGAGRAARLVAADIAVNGVGTPKGFFGHAILGSGQVQVNQSIFTTGCVYNRAHITMSGTDAYGLPAAVHSSQIITDDQGTNTNCSRSNKAIHNSNACAPGQPFDQDNLGGTLLTTSTCVSSRPASVPAATWQRYYPEGSKISSPQMLFSLYGIKDPALTQADIDRLRVIAKGQGIGTNYRITTSSSDVVTPNGNQAVLFYDLTASGGSVDLSGIRGFGHTAGSCPSRSLVVVVVGGGVVFHSGAALVASVFVTTPGMMYDANGAALVGSVYADKISLGGNAVVSAEAQECANSNPSPTLLDFNVTAYRELDG
jgi:Tfp pilus assembly protein PilX